MPKRFCDLYYEMVIDKGLTESQYIEVFYAVARDVASVGDGHGVRGVITKHKLEKYYYGGVQEKALHIKFRVRGAVWHCIQNIGYDEKFRRETAKKFKVDPADIEFVINHLFHTDILIIQDTMYDPIVDLNKYDDKKMLKSIETRIQKLVNGVRFLYMNDPAKTREDYISEATIKAMEGMRIYEGECIDEDDLSNKMYSRANSHIRNVQNKSEEISRLEKNNDGGYELKILSLDFKSEKQDSDSGYSLMDTLDNNYIDEDMHFNEYLEYVKKFCSRKVYLYVKTILGGDDTGVDKHDREYYRKIRKKIGITLKQVKKEISYVLQMRNKVKV